jgi:peptide chain release factor 1
MFDKLESLDRRFANIEDTLAQGALSGAELVKLSKERSEMEPIVMAYRSFRDLQTQLAECQEILEAGDPEMADLARDDMRRLESEMEEAEKALQILLLPTDPRDARNVLLEIRAGTGGDEAGLFAGDLLRMYSRYAENVKWKVELLSATESTKGGYKEVVLLIAGQRVFSRLKFESGVHRVQRIPETESQGRIHTSACTVAVLPEAEEVEVDINPTDLRIDTYRASGAGGQHVNRTDSAVRITHIPSGLVVECQDERSQHKNRDRAMKMLRSRLLDRMEAEQAKSRSEDRRAQVGSGDRSERIRTYNFPQGRMTDHRLNLTLYRLSEIMEGDLQEVLDKIGAFYTAEQLRLQQS